MKKTFFTFFFLTFFNVSYAQSTKFVILPNKQLVPCDHPLAISAGFNCSPNTNPPPEDDCKNINPYSEPDRAAFCAAKSIEPPRVANDYTIGSKYSDPYNNRMVIIGTTRDIYNRPVITYQFYSGFYIGAVRSFIVDVDETPFIKIN